MPKRTDLHTILVLGSGPIVIGQACEFDYAGVQAIKALRAEGYRVVLVNPNPATIMTDSGLASQVYLAPLTVAELLPIIANEKPDAILPTMGGQTALNCALALAQAGVLARYHVELIGADLTAIRMAEDRELFRQAMGEIGLTVACSSIARNIDEALAIQSDLGFPLVVRPSYTMGGSGGGIAYHRDELIGICTRGFALSPNHELLLEESLLGWHEFELEVVRDKADNIMIVCSIENLDPVGVHTGDSITVAPQQTLPDREYQQLRSAAIDIMRIIGVDTGGANVQFAVNPHDGRMCVIEMNPRVSRSSALASKATGFPIAKIAALLAVGYTLPELANDITGGNISAAFEPTLDYIVTKVPRFQFTKFKDADDRLGTQMKSVGESMAMGRSFAESLQKALAGLDDGCLGLDSLLTYRAQDETTLNVLHHELQRPGPKRIYYLADALRLGMSIPDLVALTHIHPWFIAEIATFIQAEQWLGQQTLAALTQQQGLHLKQLGMTDAAMAKQLHVDVEAIEKMRAHLGITPHFWQVDSCASEFPASTAYLYATYWGNHQESIRNDNPSILILGSGPNRIGQGIEFDYCCVHAAQSLRALGFEVLMQNNNPETVSTDYDVADKLYFEPITREAVLAIAHVEQPDAVLAQYGGQTPLRLAQTIEASGYTLLGTTAEGIALAEDRQRFSELATKLGLNQPASHMITDVSAFLADVDNMTLSVGFPLLARPSYVLGGQSMVVLTNDQQLRDYLRELISEQPTVSVQLDCYLQGAVEFDVEALVTSERTQVIAIVEHIDPAGVHSGDSAMILPAQSLTESEHHILITQTQKLAKALGVIGLLNVQFAKYQGKFYILEANPRAARTVPLIAKAFHIPLAHLGILAMVSELTPTAKNNKLIDKAKQALTEFFNHCDPSRVLATSTDVFVKLAVFPFDKFLNIDPWLGPEMRSTGEVMCSGATLPQAFARALAAANVRLPKLPLHVLLSVNDHDKTEVTALALGLQAIGATLYATAGTYEILAKAGIHTNVVNRLSGARPHILDLLENHQMNWLILTTNSVNACVESVDIRRFAKQHDIYLSTSLAYANQILAVLSQPINDDVIASWSRNPCTMDGIGEAERIKELILVET